MEHRRPADLTVSAIGLGAMPLSIEGRPDDRGRAVATIHAALDAGITLIDTADAYHVDSSDPPFFIGHSSDERIPLSQSASFVKRLRSSGVDVTFVTVKGHEHSIAMLDLAMRNRIAAFFHAKLVQLPFDVETH